MFFVTENGYLQLLAVCSIVSILVVSVATRRSKNDKRNLALRLTKMAHFGFKANSAIITGALLLHLILVSSAFEMECWHFLVG